MVVERYGNLSGDSPIRAFRIGAAFIEVQFGDQTYVYTYERTGPAHVENMKRRALSGRGLATYISKYVKDRFAAKH